MVTAAEWRRANPAMHPLLRAFLFLSALNVEWDALHILYLGVFGYMLGSVLAILVRTVMRGTSDENMAAVWQYIIQFYNENATPQQLSALSIASFIAIKDRATSYPRLKGNGGRAETFAGCCARCLA